MASSSIALNRAVFSRSTPKTAFVQQGEILGLLDGEIERVAQRGRAVAHEGRLLLDVHPEVRELHLPTEPEPRLQHDVVAHLVGVAHRVPHVPLDGAQERVGAQELVGADKPVHGGSLHEDHGPFGSEVVRGAPLALALRHDRPGGVLAPSRGKAAQDFPLTGGDSGFAHRVSLHGAGPRRNGENVEMMWFSTFHKKCVRRRP